MLATRQQGKWKATNDLEEDDHEESPEVIEDTHPASKTDRLNVEDDRRRFPPIPWLYKLPPCRDITRPWCMFDFVSPVPRFRKMGPGIDWKNPPAEVSDGEGPDFVDYQVKGQMLPVAVDCYSQEYQVELEKDDGDDDKTEEEIMFGYGEESLCTVTVYCIIRKSHPMEEMLVMKEHVGTTYEDACRFYLLDDPLDPKHIPHILRNLVYNWSVRWSLGHPDEDKDKDDTRLSYHKAIKDTKAAWKVLQKIDKNQDGEALYDHEVQMVKDEGINHYYRYHGLIKDEEGNERTAKTHCMPLQLKTGETDVSVSIPLTGFSQGEEPEVLMAAPRLT
ncbi:hypothetical protein BDM02DRAFT_3228277 [Thelephora ganbajun]|uniref:Uncharacterized protein n=1 Tax=Thelephora ganbajun TaxID=370292 RepID=A0ACB6Z066_THEGA|nr:hypothetical protein BDM02DRAFT_3228277 [Thelephora ganbajun]